MSTQISAYISNETKTLFENYSRKTGQKKAYIIEEALLHYFNASQDLPADIITPPSITVSKKVYDEIIAAEREPTEALRELMNEG